MNADNSSHITPDCDKAKAAAHTPGPWTLESIDGHFRVYGGIFPGAVRAVVDVADVWSIDKAADQHAANANLIAAAPELLEAVRELYDIVGRNGLACSSRARSAIQRAERGGE